MTKIHVIGDCHSLAFESVPNCTVHHLNSVTMHRVGRDKLDIVDLQKFNIEPEDICIFSFGEIDARIHIAKQRDINNRHVDEIIDTLVTNYIHTINLNRERYGNFSIVYTIVPASNLGIEINPTSFYSTVEDRLGIVKKLNAELIKKCSESNIAVLDVYDDYANEQGYLRPEISASFHIHPNHNAAIIKRLEMLLSKHNKV
jgi:hypothetical protein